MLDGLTGDGPKPYALGASSKSDVGSGLKHMWQFQKQTDVASVVPTPFVEWVCIVQCSDFHRVPTSF